MEEKSNARVLGWKKAGESQYGKLTSDTPALAPLLGDSPRPPLCLMSFYGVYSYTSAEDSSTKSVHRNLINREQFVDTFISCCGKLFNVGIESTFRASVEAT